MICANCGRNIDPDAKFCKHCGHKTLPNDKSKKNNHIGLKVILLILLVASVIFLLYAYNTKNDVSQNKSAINNINSCNRTQRYENPPEFDRALSFIHQRTIESAFRSESISNCIAVKYDDGSRISEAEGFFIFDPNIANANYLPIFVNRSYNAADLIETALLLRHEMAHANQYIIELHGIKYLSCLDKEVEAFQYQFAFLTSLNKEELDSLITRLNYSSNLHPQLQFIKDSILYFQSRNNSGSRDLPSDMENYYKNLVYNSPFYQKECAGK